VTRNAGKKGRRKGHHGENQERPSGGGEAAAIKGQRRPACSKNQNRKCHWDQILKKVFKTGQGTISRGQPLAGGGCRLTKKNDSRGGEVQGKVGILQVSCQKTGARSIWQMGGSDQGVWPKRKKTAGGLKAGKKNPPTKVIEPQGPQEPGRDPGKGKRKKERRKLAQDENWAAGNSAKKQKKPRQTKEKNTARGNGQSGCHGKKRGLNPLLPEGPRCVAIPQETGRNKKKKKDSQRKTFWTTATR